jgi:hypothetical protein
VQDIHLRRNLLERWLGIGRVQVQTASGGGGAELVIEGVAEFVEVRDFLYSKMRGATAHPTQPHGGSAEALVLLKEIKAELQQTRAALLRTPATTTTTPATTTTTTTEPGHG